MKFSQWMKKKFQNATERHCEQRKMTKMVHRFLLFPKENNAVRQLARVNKTPSHVVERIESEVYEHAQHKISIKCVYINNFHDRETNTSCVYTYLTSVDISMSFEYQIRPGMYTHQPLPKRLQLVFGWGFIVAASLMV